MRIFVTGATGFAGSHLLDLLLAAGHEIHALVHPATSTQSLPENPKVFSVEGDLLDLAGLKTAVSAVEPDVIYHLAGQPYPAKSWINPALTLAINTGGTANLLEAAVQVGRPRVVVVTSAEIYGRIRPENLPISEALVPEPRHPYGISKWAAAELVRVYWQRYQLPVVEARPFNHIGPRQALGFVVPDFASQVAAIALKKQSTAMKVGNLEAQRDFTDVRDVVRAYVALAERGEPGEGYLICSSAPVSIQHILSTLVEIAGVDVEIANDPARMRPSDVPILYASFEKLKQDTGWQPEIPLRQSLKDVLDGWMLQIEAA
ncbi:MAG: GDP-mannose 4,6-dehydratase [Chloroflexi bacterium]|nr:GDP-mannose 4,6-dehydratase [Chloroflexota bacterium]